jgi:ferritin-like metal-binding protein YciE
MKIESVETLFEEEIKDLYDAEKQLVRALPKLAKAATTEDLITTFQEHLEVTKAQVGRLEKVFQLLGVKPKSKPCEAMKGLVAEGEEAIEQDGEDILRDVMLIGAAKRVEHYEMAGYQSAILLADSMGIEEAADLLRQTLTEEEEADGKLESLCEQLLENRDSETELEGDAGTEDRTRKTARTKASRGV